MNLPLSCARFYTTPRDLTDKAEWVRANVAMNPTRPPDLQAIMAQDSAELVRLAARDTMRRLDRARWVSGR
jgi:hypothetical protein